MYILKKLFLTIGLSLALMVVLVIPSFISNVAYAKNIITNEALRIG